MITQDHGRPRAGGSGGVLATGTYGLKVQMCPNPLHSAGDHLSPARTSRSLTLDFFCKEHQGPLRSTSLSLSRWEHAPPLPTAGSRPPFHVVHQPPCVQNSPTKQPQVRAALPTTSSRSAPRASSWRRGPVCRWKAALPFLSSEPPMRFLGVGSPGVGGRECQEHVCTPQKNSTLGRGPSPFPCPAQATGKKAGCKQVTRTVKPSRREPRVSSGP